MSAASILLSEGFQSVLSMEGGINAWNGFVGKGFYDQGMCLLKGEDTDEELITIAWSLEDGSRLFYDGAAGLTADNESKQLFRTLAEAEARHKENILDTYRMTTGNNIDAVLVEKAALKGVMESGAQVQDVIALLQERGGGLKDILEVSMQIEVNALDLYIKMSRKIKEKNAVKILGSLIDEEKRHLLRLGNLLGERYQTKS